MKIEFFVLGIGNPNFEGKFPEWKRMAGVQVDEPDPSKREVFFAAALFGSEESVLYSVVKDGVSYCICDDRSYIPFSWVQLEYPARAKDLEYLVVRLRGSPSPNQ